MATINDSTGQKKGILHDNNGGLSSKRIAGFAGLAGLIFIAVFAVIKDPSQAYNVMWPIATVTGACFSVTVMERITK
jgi:hypothetical protein